MASIALALGLGSAVAGVGSSLIGSSAASKAAKQQEQSAQQAIAEQDKIFNQQQANQQPYLTAGSTSLSQLMSALQAGKFGPGSTGAVPTFKAPTLQDIQQTPGYQFTRDQGSKGILQGAAAAGGTIGGGTLKSLDQYNTNLADTTYGNDFTRALQSYQANLSGYQTELAAQGQEFNQLFAPAQLGEGATQSINQSGTAAGTNISNLLTGAGNAAAAGTVGSSNAINSGIGTAVNGISQGVLLSKLLGGPNSSFSAAAPPPASQPLPSMDYSVPG